MAGVQEASVSMLMEPAQEGESAQGVEIVNLVPGQSLTWVHHWSHVHISKLDITLHVQNNKYTQSFQYIWLLFHSPLFQYYT